jgi:thiol-disulfide isomerase/thioredoxin
MNNRNPISIALAAVAALVLLAIGVVVLTAGGEEASVAALEVADAVEVEGSPLPPFSLPDPAVGMTAPVVASQTATGTDVELGRAGEPTVIGFVAHWCPHCQQELPQLVDWVGNGIDGVDVVLVSTAVDENAENHPPSAWIAREEWDGTVVVDDVRRTVAGSFGLTGFPFWVALDANGVVVARSAGQINEATFDSLVAAAAE